ncbi:hypothetical protein HK096_000745 [Nowakowskiella sp. JEL0078]|nr:hypothetical protein HK096_000745 [Nowakowskiella sp. JEL0078]
MIPKDDPKETELSSKHFDAVQSKFPFPELAKKRYTFVFVAIFITVAIVIVAIVSNIISHSTDSEVSADMASISELHTTSNQAETYANTFSVSKSADESSAIQTNSSFINGTKTSIMNFQTKTITLVISSVTHNAVVSRSSTQVSNVSPTSNPNMPSGFSGTNSGIGSWFSSNSGDSNTNGNSWCGYPYKDYTPGFAPDISIMTDWSNAVYGNPNWSTYAKRYCGLEAIVTNPNTGVSRILYITDAFDHKYVLSQGSIDIMKNSFDALFGKTTWNHNDVIQGVTWKFTGMRSSKYSFGGWGDA